MGAPREDDPGKGSPGQGNTGLDSAAQASTARDSTGPDTMGSDSSAQDGSGVGGPGLDGPGLNDPGPHGPALANLAGHSQALTGRGDAGPAGPGRAGDDRPPARMATPARPLSGQPDPVLSALSDPPPDLSQLEARAAEASAFLKKLANQDRLLIVCALIGGETSVGALEETLGLRQPSLSQQLRELREAGLIRGRKDGKQMFYTLADPRAEALVATLYQVFCR